MMNKILQCFVFLRNMLLYILSCCMFLFGCGQKSEGGVEEVKKFQKIFEDKVEELPSKDPRVQLFELFKKSGVDVSKLKPQEVEMFKAALPKGIEINKKETSFFGGLISSIVEHGPELLDLAMSILDEVKSRKSSWELRLRSKIVFASMDSVKFFGDSLDNGVVKESSQHKPLSLLNPHDFLRDLLFGSIRWNEKNMSFLEFWKFLDLQDLLDVILKHCEKQGVEIKGVGSAGMIL